MARHHPVRCSICSKRKTEARKSAAILVALAYPHKHDTALIVRPDWSRREAVHTARDGVRRTDLMRWRTRRGSKATAGRAAFLAPPRPPPAPSAAGRRSRSSPAADRPSAPFSISRHRAIIFSAIFGPLSWVASENPALPKIAGDHRYAARSLRRHVEGARRERLRYRRQATRRLGSPPDQGVIQPDFITHDPHVA